MSTLLFRLLNTCFNLNNLIYFVYPLLILTILRWLARCQSGKQGLVPKNYVQIVSDDDIPSSAAAAASAVHSDISKLVLSNGSPRPQNKSSVGKSDVLGQAWYFGLISRSHCDSLLNEFASDGDFLVRDSETNVSLLFYFIFIFSSSLICRYLFTPPPLLLFFPLSLSLLLFISLSHLFRPAIFQCH